MSSDRIQPPASWKKAASTSIIPIAAAATTTTIRNCNNDEKDEQQIAPSARRIPKPSSATTAKTTAATVRSHSPRKIKTQTAKLVYNPSMTAKSNRGDVNETPKNVKVAGVGEFQKKRLDRDKEVKEIQEMLNEITKTPTKPKKPTEGEEETSPKVVVPAKNSPPKQPTTTIQRSKTDTNLRRPTARKIQPRQESQTARCKSAHVEDKSSPPKQRQKTYSSEEAQRYMQEQKKKRRSLQTVMQGTNSKPSIDKDEIKKRLENLRQNTRKIVDKNVKIAKKKAGTTEDKPYPRREDLNVINKATEVPLRTKVVEAWPERVLKPPQPSSLDEGRIEFPKETDVPAKASSIEAWAEKGRLAKLMSPPKNHLDPSLLAENFKKIGLLRKSEYKDHSFSAIKDIHLDKENFIADILTPQTSGLPTSRLVADGENLLLNAITPNFLEQPTTRLMAEGVPQQSAISNNTNLERKLSDSSSYGGKSMKRRSSPELELHVPEAKLRSRASMREKSVQADSTVLGSSKALKTNAELPYWLKPTLVQAYPYNFIMAVRKKLEAIANPPVASSSSSSMDQQAAKKTAAETPVSYEKTNRSNNVKRRIIDSENNTSRSPEKSSSNKENIGESRLSKSFSEVTSNFSSISIKLPHSNNTISNYKAEPQQFDEDATTVSSSVFSSPEKKKNFNGRSKNLQPEALSPLSMDNISNLHIKSKAMMSNITLGRGDDYENTSSHRSMKSAVSMTNRSDASVDFSQLLDDFNRSLSQVIEVNQQLKTTLVKSQIFSPEKKGTSVLTTNRVELAEYVSDFEESSNAGENSESVREPLAAQSVSSIHEVHEESSKHSSEINTQKSFSASSSNEEVPEEEEESQSSFKNIQSRSSNPSPLSLATQTFIVSSSEEKGQNSTRTQTIHEEAIEESPNKENMSGNQYSLDSLETSQHEDYIKSHINTSRGDYDRIELPAGPPPPSYKVSSESQARSSPNFMNSSLDSEFVRIFNKSDMEISVLSLNRSLSESTVNYSSIGMYEKLIQNETNKSDHLAALLKMREKALIDRTKGQIAWLEVQKERYKSKGLVFQISAVKKKQRGILLKMEKEREEIKKLLQRAKVQRDDNKLRIPENRPFSDVTLLQQRRAGIQISSTSHQKQQHQSRQRQQSSARSKSSSAIVKGYELETSRSLEQLLQKREEDLRRRREHVERLMEWHRRLDQEEAEVLQLERILLDYNNVHVQQQQQQQNEIVTLQEKNLNRTKMEKKLKDIDRSLLKLSSISGADASTDAGVGSGEFVRTSGTKLNKLWSRLTSQRIEKFQPNKRYKLCKADVEQLYEDAKLAVLHDFGEGAGQMEVFLGQTSIISTPQPSNHSHSMEIPQLNLNFSSGQSEEDMMMRGNYSPSAAEEGFVVPSTSSQDGLSDDSSLRKKATSRNSSSSAMQSLPECYSLNSNGQERWENAQNHEEQSITSKGLHNNINKVSSDMDSKLRFSTQNANVSGISINYVLSSKNESDATVSVKDSTKGSNKSKNSQVFENCIKNESDPKKESNSKTDDDINAMSNRSFSSSTATRSNQTKTNETDTTKENNTKGSHRIASQIESASTGNNTDTLGNLSNTIETIDDLASTIPELTNSHGANQNIETTVNDQSPQSTSHSLLDITKGNSQEISPYNSSRNIQINSEIEAFNSSSKCSTKPRDKTSGSIEIDSTQVHLTGKSSLESIETANNAQSQLQNSSTEGVTELISKSSKNFSGNVPSNTETGHTENVSNVKTLTASSRTSSSTIKSETLTSASHPNISSSLKENDFFSDFEAETESDKIITETSDNDKVRKAAPASGSAKSTEECASVSILKSLLNSTYSNNSIIFSSNQVSSTVSDIQAQLRTNGHDCPNWTNNLTPAKEHSLSQSPKDEPPTIATQVSRSESLTYPDEATLRSIKSIDDNSTNSKHSTDPFSNPIQISTEEDIRPNQIRISKSSEDIPQSYSSAFEFDSVSSNQARSSVIMSIKSPPFQVEVVSESLTNAFYESDFTEGEETNIDDISLPKFETTAEEEEQLDESLSQPAASTSATDLEKRLINLDVSLKDLDATFEKALSPEKTLSPPRDDDGKRSQQQNDSALMPDIISEVELRRRHQAMLENELKQFEHAVPYMFVREIPNKPPPPYVPPAHGSPMTTIFPSEERIKDITFRRTKELYCEILNIDTKDDLGKKPPSVLDENITNIYERIILDICKEYLTEYKPILTSADPNNFHSSLAFFNPPDRLRCMQEFIYKEVRKNLAMDKNTPEKSQLYSVYGHRGKRDHIGEIIIQEMFEEDNIWSNFYVEEEEVLELIIEEIVSATMRDICTAVLRDEVPRDSTTPTPDADESVEMCCNNST